MKVISMIPNEQEGESFTEAVSRVCRCIGGGMAAANDDSDSDLEVIADNVTINLRCPVTILIKPLFNLHNLVI